MAAAAIRIGLGAIPGVGPIAQGLDYLHTSLTTGRLPETTVPEIAHKITVVSKRADTYIPWTMGSVIQAICTFIAARLLSWSRLGTWMFVAGITYAAFNACFTWR